MTMSKPDYSKWHTVCLLRELDRKLLPEVARSCSRDYILSLIRVGSPSSMEDKCGGYSLCYLIGHLLDNWDWSYNPIIGLDHLKKELKGRYYAHCATLDQPPF